LFAVRGVRDANGKHLFTLSHPRQAVIRIDKCELRLPGRPSRTARAVALGPATRFAPRTAVGEPNYASRKQSFSSTGNWPVPGRSLAWGRPDSRLAPPSRMARFRITAVAARISMRFMGR